MDDLISRQAAKNKKVYSEERHEYVIPVAEIDWLPSAQPDGWLARHRDEILKAGMEGREFEFRIDGRLFAIREKAQ